MWGCGISGAAFELPRGDSVASLETISPKNFAYHITVFEICKRDGSEFPPQTVHHIVGGLQHFVRWKNNPALDIFKDDGFADFRQCLDSKMKRLQRAGLGSRRKAEPLTEAGELLWSKGLLGDSSPQS